MITTEQTTRDLKSIFGTLETRLAETTGTALYEIVGDAPCDAETALLVDFKNRVGAALGLAGRADQDGKADLEAT